MLQVTTPARRLHCSAMPIATAQQGHCSTVLYLDRDHITQSSLCRLITKVTNVHDLSNQWSVDSSARPRVAQVQATMLAAADGDSDDSD
jgi:hypothetical protein